MAFSGSLRLELGLEGITMSSLCNCRLTAFGKLRMVMLLKFSIQYKGKAARVTPSCVRKWPCAFLNDYA